MKSHTLPVELQPVHDTLRGLRKPAEPYHQDTVKESETAFEGESLLEFLLYAITPWWAEGMFEGGSGETAEKDYLIGVPLAFVVAATCLGFGTDLSGWEVFAMAMIAAASTFLGLILFHVIFHKYITMVIYNRVFRRDWVKKTRIADEVKYREDVETYPQRLREYEEARERGVQEATVALEVYHSTSPTQRYKMGTYGLDQVKGFASSQARSMMGKIFQR